MKLIIQIPCFNEEGTLAQTIRDLPRQLPGIEVIEYQIINDGSTDGTIKVARELGVHHIVDLGRNRGLAQAFKAGIEHALYAGADIIVNTDADNQYCGEDVAALVGPILRGEADIVVGARPIIDHPEFSMAKKILQKVGSWVIRKASGTSVEDAPSGFRAYTKAAAMHMNILTRFSYTLETLIQAGHSGMRVMSVPIRVNPKTRDSRLFKSMSHYIKSSGMTIIRVFIVYRSSWFFSALSIVFFAISLALAARYAYIVFILRQGAANFWPSILLAGFLLVMGFQMILTGILAELAASNRKLLEEILFKERIREYRGKTDDNKN